MANNVKPGDLAMINRLGAANHGRLVRVVRPAHQAYLQLLILGQWWECEALQRLDRYSFDDGQQNGFFVAGDILPMHDSALRRLDPGPGEDETLRWAGKPKPFTFEDLVTLERRHKARS